MRHLVALFLTLILLQGCRDKIICSAFQSTYILDDSVRSVYYSYLWKLDEEERLKYLADHRPAEDTSVMVAGLAANTTDYFAYVEPYVVPPREVKKSKFGIVKYEPYWLRNYHQRTAPMENILSPPPVEQAMPVDTGEFVASDFADSVDMDLSAELPADSMALASGGAADTSVFELPKIGQPEPPKTRRETTYLYRYDPKDSLLNVEQEYYNWYFGKYLVRVRDVPINPPDIPADSSGFWAKIKEFFTFKWAFKGKLKADEDETAETALLEDENNEAILPEDQEPVPDDEKEEGGGF